MSKVIVFGPTGAVGSNAALFAQEQGAKVALAMRDTKKSIPGLSAELEKSGGFERVQADLMDAESVGAAVRQTGAKRAFFYLAFGSPDNMHATIQALKGAGIELAVFLSSLSVPIDRALRDCPRSEIIPYLHASVEAELQEIFGPTGYVAVRGGAFASNTLQFKHGIAEGNATVLGPDYRFDAVVPSNIGRVAGSVLAHGPRNGQREIYVLGPKIISQREAIQTICNVLGKTAKITPLTNEEGVVRYRGEGLPPPVADYLVKVFTAPDLGASFWPQQEHETGVANVLTYTGKPSQGFEEYVRENKALFTV